ncbi:MAG TPA: hypothetical protein VHD90_17520, partial [Phototrophicaceae bacterium]|nr:hypothetical protein [Phototrophicaceae bacterium]
ALPFMVNFEYLPQGIRVRGRWYPILKMDWTPGIRLDTYIEQHLDEPQRLRQLGERWIAVCRALREANIAHGDLQHGNILVTDQHEIKLIDYDGMIIPDVIDLPNAEIGHRHYQHPTRTNDDGLTLDSFGGIDNFSEHVIGLSLLALSLDPSLWTKTQAGEENLLFRASDYKEPENSAALDLLVSHDDQRVRALGQSMIEAVQVPFYLDVPPLTHSPLEQFQGWSWVKTWLASHVPSTAPIPAALQETPRDSWVFDHLQPQPLDFSDEFIIHERIALEVEFQQSLLRPYSRLFMPFALMRILMRYPRYSLVIEKNTIERLARDLSRQLIDAKARRKTLSRLIVEAERRYQQEVRSLEASLSQLRSDLDYAQRQETREIAQWERTLQSLITELARQTLEVGKVEGIGAAQIDALHQIGIKNAADINPSNEAAALHVLSDLSGGTQRWVWNQLLDWRHVIEQQVSPMPITADDVSAARQRYAALQDDLKAQQQNTVRQLESVTEHSDHLRLAQSLRAELDESEAQVAQLQQQVGAALAERARYELITLRRFLSQALDFAPLS